MDGSHFDQLTRDLVAHASRRHTLRWLAGSLTGALLGLRSSKVLAACPSPCGPCERCGPEDICEPDPTKDGNACGAQETECLEAGVCRDGECVQDPKDGEPCEVSNNPCMRDFCEAGTCRHERREEFSPCPDDGNECTEDVCRFGECEHRISASTEGKSCEGGAGICSRGVCCPNATPNNCSGSCVNLKTDPHCGTCGTNCPDTQICAACKDDCIGRPVAKCCPTTKRTNCSGVCVNTRTDEANCGRCGKRCRRKKVCKKGTCV